MTRAAQLAQAATGGVLQVVQTQDNTYRSTTADFPVDSGLSATITPISSSSKILVRVTPSLYISSGTNNNQIIVHGIYRGSTQLMTSRTSMYIAGGGYPGDMFWGQNGLEWLDAPNTTSAITYKYYWGRWAAQYNNVCMMNDGGHSGSTTGRQYSTITLTEIAG